jgi:hypothetical protein
MSRIDRIHAHDKAELVLRAFVSILDIDEHLAKFNAALPSARILLLLLGTSPSSTTASLILRLTGIHISAFPNFSRKLEVTNFWSILSAALPNAWGTESKAAAFDILFGKLRAGEPSEGEVVKHPAILPSIFASLEYGLNRLLERGMYVGELQVPDPNQCEAGISILCGRMLDRSAIHLISNFAPAVEVESTFGSEIEDLLERFIELHASSPTFKIAFRSKCLSAFISMTKSFVPRASQISSVSNGLSTRLSDKLLHLTMMLTLDTTIPKSQILEVRLKLAAQRIYHISDHSSNFSFRN